MATLLSVLLIAFSPLVAEDCNSNGIDDAIDIANGTSQDCNSNAVPDECDLEQLEPYKLHVPWAEADDEWGTRVAVSEKHAVIAAYNEPEAALFEWRGDGWAFEQMLEPWDLSSDGFYCVALGMQDDIAVLGVRSADWQEQAAYVFERNGVSWARKDKLTPWSLQPGEAFAQSISMDDGILVISAANWDDNPVAPGSGAAYVYRYVAGHYEPETRLDVPGPHTYRSGERVDVHGDRIIISASQQDVGGLAYVFRYGTGQWTLEQVLAPDNPSPLQFFARDVAINGNTVVAGASHDDFFSWLAGAAYVFRHDGIRWRQTMRLGAPLPERGGYWGSEVELDGAYLLVGSGNYGRLNGPLAAFHDSDGTWPLFASWPADADVVGMGLGRAIAIDYEWIIVGAPYDDTIVENGGAAYAIRLPDADSDGVIAPCDLCRRTEPGGAVDKRGCTADARADADNDGDVDSDDQDQFESCSAGPSVSPPDEDCLVFDFDIDGDVDQSDFGIFQRCMSGANIPADPACAD